MAPKVATYGTWESPITSDAVVESAIGFPSIFIDPITSTIYHIESRPKDAGRCVIVETCTEKDVFGSEWNARSRVEEYGGGAAIAYGGMVYFSNFTDLRVYSVDINSGSEPTAVTPDNEKYRYADFTVLPTHPHLLVAILEDHTIDIPFKVLTSLVVIDTSAKTLSPVVSGADFYASPRFSPDGKYLVWQQWWHPDMPWQGGEIYVAKVSINDGEIKLGEKSLVGGIRSKVSAAYPSWLSNDKILFTSDETGYQNPYLYSVLTGKSAPILPVVAPWEAKSDFSLPAWYLGGSYSAMLDEKGEKVLYSIMRDGRSVLYILDVKSGELIEIESDLVDISSVCSIPKSGAVLFVGGQTDDASEILIFIYSPASSTPSASFETLKSTSFETLKSASPSTTSLSFSPEIFSVAQPMTVKVPPDDDPIHLNFYPPKNPDYIGPEGTKPPCVFSVHGGPTGISSQALNWTTQYFTSRGWAWVDVNYGGSYGYGRKYIDRLQGQWGVSDIRDNVIAARDLSVSSGLIDLSHIFIRGGSSGGYTALAAISNPPPDAPSDVKWTGATSYYGISDLKKLAEDTHKFESKYPDGLLGGSYDEIPEVWDDRSPINHVDNIDTPLLILQGSEDKVVPPEQAQLIADSMEKRGKKYKYILFQGEGHGFRKAENIKKALEEELSWYRNLI